MTSPDPDPPDPPDEGAGAEADADAPDAPSIACPHCGSADVERHSRFGSEVSSQQWYCHGCSTVFERLRYDGERPDTGR